MNAGKSNQNISKKISEIFTSVQESRGCHAKYIKKLKQIYEKVSYISVFIFISKFIFSNFFSAN